MRKITKGDYDVTDFYGVDEETNTVYFASAERSPLNRDIYAVKLNGKNKRVLTDKIGTNKATFSTSFKYFINILMLTHHIFLVYTMLVVHK